MTRRAVAAAALGLATLAAAGWWTVASRDRRPSILLVTIDTLRADHVGVYGASGVRTPTLDALAAGGIRFEAAYTAAPLTLPAHVSMLSGRLPAGHTVRTNDGYRVPDGVVLVGSRLQAAGYRTAAFVGASVLRRDDRRRRRIRPFRRRHGRRRRASGRRGRGAGDHLAAAARRRSSLSVGPRLRSAPAVRPAGPVRPAAAGPTTVRSSTSTRPWRRCSSRPRATPAPAGWP